VNSIAWVYLPYFAFLGLAIAGLYWQKEWVVIVAVVFMAFYNVKPELEIICKRTIYNECEFYIEKEQEQSK
jgi:hypothetical protein